MYSQSTIKLQISKHQDSQEKGKKKKRETDKRKRQPGVEMISWKSFFGVWMPLQRFPNIEHSLTEIKQKAIWNEEWWMHMNAGMQKVKYSKVQFCIFWRKQCFELWGREVWFGVDAFCVCDGSDVGCKIERQVKSDAQIQDCFGGFGESSVAIDVNVNISCKC